jgi:uncharacterized protein YeaO (DUF488 family)
MSNEFECTFEEFKQRFNEFRLAEPDLDDDELDNAHKMLALSYLCMTEDMWRNSAVILLNMASKIMIERNLI